jgi:acyl-CoA synthetase (AMP-forming)/AMP-acid ligase II
VPREFLVKMKAMAPRIGTGLGLTETAGFCTYTNVAADVDELAQGIGYDSPLCPLTIRHFMNPDGTAGAEKPPGEAGEICFSGPQIFLGYMGDPENTAKTVSKEGICYTGDVGTYDDKGLHFSGRAKLVIKPKGYQVFPEDLERHIHAKLKDKVALVSVVGVEHEVFSEAIVAFVECLDGKTLTPEEVIAACGDISAYSRPSHVVILKASEIPLNRVAKTDYLTLRERATQVVKELRSQGGWDRG